MSTVLLLFALTPVSCATAAVTAPAGVEVVERRTQDVDQGGGMIRYDVRELRVSVQQDDGKTSERHLLIAYEPRTRLGWWVSHDLAEMPRSYRPVFPGRLLGTSSNVGVSGDALAVFFVDGSFPTIAVDESRARFRSADDAEREIVAKLRRSPPAGNEGTARRHMVELASQLPPLFRIAPDGAHIATPLTLPRVARQPDGWIVTLRGPRGDLADITINDQYQLIGVRTYR